MKRTVEKWKPGRAPADFFFFSILSSSHLLLRFRLSLNSFSVTCLFSLVFAGLDFPSASFSAPAETGSISGQRERVWGKACRHFQEGKLIWRPNCLGCSAPGALTVQGVVILVGHTYGTG